MKAVFKLDKRIRGAYHPRERRKYFGDSNFWVNYVEHQTLMFCSQSNGKFLTEDPEITSTFYNLLTFSGNIILVELLQILYYLQIIT